MEDGDRLRLHGDGYHLLGHTISHSQLNVFICDVIYLILMQ